LVKLDRNDEAVESYQTAAEHYAQQSLKLRRQLGDRWGTALALFTLGWVAEYQGMWQVAKRRYHESMELRRGMREDIEGVMDCLDGMGRVARRMGDYDEARRLYLEILAFAREIGNRWRIARSLESLGLVAYDMEEYAEAKRYVGQSLALYEDGGAKFRIAFSTGTLGHVALALGNHGKARRCFERALGIDACNFWTLLGLGRLSDALGNEAAALEYFHRVLRCAAEYHLDAVAVSVLIDVARLMLKGDVPEQTVELLGFVLNHHALSHSAKVRAEQLLAEAANALPAETIEIALAIGKARELGAVIGGILGISEPPPEEQDLEVEDAPDYIRRLLDGRFA
jgi:tetratricopeptide (TPR) repeat protein